MVPHSPSTVARCCAAWPTSPSTCWWSAAASRASAWRSTPPRGACAPPWSSEGDFASGTSSKSSKLVHGGLRYLQQGEVRLVYEALAERQRLRQLAPHLVRTLPFLIPIFTKGGVVPPKVARALGTAMWGYDLTGGVRIGKLHKRLTADEALAHLPTLPARAPGQRLPLLRRPGRRRPAVPRRGPHRRRRTAPRSPTTAASWRLHQGRRRPGRAAPRSRPTATASRCAARPW